MIFVILIPEHFQATLISKDDNCVEGSLGYKLDGLGVILNDLLSSNQHSALLPSPAQNPFLEYLCHIIFTDYLTLMFNYQKYIPLSYHLHTIQKSLYSIHHFQRRNSEPFQQ